MSPFSGSVDTVMVANHTVTVFCSYLKSGCADYTTLIKL